MIVLITLGSPAQPFFPFDRTRVLIELFLGLDFCLPISSKNHDAFVQVNILHLYWD